MRGLADAISLMLSSPSGVSVAMGRIRVEPNVTPCCCSQRSIRATTRRTSSARWGLGTTYPSGRPAIVSAMSASAYSLPIGFIRTQRSRPPKSRVSSQRRTIGRVAAFRSGVTASSRSRISPSAGSVSALAIIFSLPPGTKWSERLTSRPRGAASSPRAGSA